MLYCPTCSNVMNYTQLFSTDYYSEDNMSSDCMGHNDYCNYVDLDEKPFITKFYCTNSGCLPRNLIEKWKIENFKNKYAPLLCGTAIPQYLALDLESYINLAILPKTYACDEYYFLFPDNISLVAMIGKSSAPWHKFINNTTSLINLKKDKATVIIEVPFISIDLNRGQSLKQATQSLFDKLIKLRAFA